MEKKTSLPHLVDGILHAEHQVVIGHVVESKPIPELVLVGKGVRLGISVVADIARFKSSIQIKSIWDVFEFLADAQWKGNHLGFHQGEFQVRFEQQEVLSRYYIILIAPDQVIAITKCPLNPIGVIAPT